MSRMLKVHCCVKVMHFLQFQVSSWNVFNVIAKKSLNLMLTIVQEPCIDNSVKFITAWHDMILSGIIWPFTAVKLSSTWSSLKSLWE